MVLNKEYWDIGQVLFSLKKYFDQLTDKICRILILDAYNSIKPRANKELFFTFEKNKPCNTLF